MVNDERRQHERKVFSDHVLLQIGTDHGDVFERARILNISREGICFTNIKVLRGFEPLKDNILQHNQVLAYFHDNQITVFGTISRLDPQLDILALSIKRSTDDDLWEKLCA